MLPHAKDRAMVDTDRLLSDVRTLARETLVPLAEAADHARVDRDMVRGLATTGLLGQLFPRSLGGSEEAAPTAARLCLLREGLATECTLAETTFAVQGLGSYPLFLAGADHLRRLWIPRVARGEAVAAFALTEPGAGSDAAALTLAARRDGDGFRLTGEKTWISHAPDADFYTVFARTSDDGARGVTAFLVEANTPGLTGTPLQLLAPHPIGSLEFDDVLVSAHNMLGEEGRGFRVAMATLNRFRPSVGAAAVGMGQAALEIATRHATTRRAFGRPIGEFQAVSHRLADMATRLEAARLLVRQAALAHDEERHDVSTLAAMSKLFATETAQDVIDGAIQILGASALQAGHPLERSYREVRALRIYEGTSEIQRNIIAKQVLATYSTSATEQDTP